MSATGTKAAKKSLDTEAIADVVVKSKRKAKKIPAALNLVPTPKKASKNGKAPKLVNVKTTAAGKVKPEPVTVPAGQKFCKRCGTVKDLSEFASDKSNKVDFHYSICKADEKLDRDAKKARMAAAVAPVAPVAAAPAAKKGKKK